MAIEFPPSEEFLSIDLSDNDTGRAYWDIARLILLGNRDQAWSLAERYGHRWEDEKLAMDILEHAAIDVDDLNSLTPQGFTYDELQDIKPQYRGIGTYIIWPS